MRGIDARLTQRRAWTFEHESARRTLLDQLKAQSLSGFGLDDRPAAVRAAGALVQYLRDTQKADLAHVRDIAFRAGADCLLDRSDDAAQPRGDRGGGRRPRPARCSTRSIAR